MRPFLVVLFFALGLDLVGIAPAAAVEVMALRLWAGPDSTRVVLDLSASSKHSLTLLKDPDRIVVDIPDAHLKRGQHNTQTGIGSVKQMRVAPRDGGALRVVLDLSHSVQAKSFLAAPTGGYGYRLVIDLAGATAGDTPIKVEHAPPDARDLIVAVDAGHGGEDPGAIGKNGTREKNVVLAIAKELARQINTEAGMRAFLTRDGDYFVALRDRMRRARSRQADLFVSVHADSIRDRNVNGSSVYILSNKGATDEASRWLAARENASDLVGGVSLEDKDDVLASVLLDLSQSASLSASQTAAYSVLRRLDQVGEVRKRQVQQAGFVVLKSPDVPSMLVETAYISNPAEEQRLRQRGHQIKLADAIHQGVHDYFYANPPAGTRVAQIALQGSADSRVATASSPHGAGN